MENHKDQLTFKEKVNLTVVDIIAAIIGYPIFFVLWVCWHLYLFICWLLIFLKVYKKQEPGVGLFEYASLGHKGHKE